MHSYGDEVSEESAREANTEPAASDDEEYSRRGFMEAAGAAGAAGAATGLAGCLDSLGGDDSSGSGEPDFLWWTMRGYVPAEQEAIEEAAAGFEDYSDDPVNLTTNVITWDSVFEQWSSSISGQNTPNVSEMANEHAVDFGNEGVVRENTDLYEQYDDWYETPSIWGQYEDEFWGFPWFIEIRHLYANTSVLDDAGVGSMPETWAELISAAQDVQGAEGDAFGFGTGAARDGATGQAVYSTATQNGAQWYDYDEDAGEWQVTMDDGAALFAHLWYASFQEAWDVTPGGWSGMTNTEIEQLYNDNRIGFMLNTGDAARTMAENGGELFENTELVMTPEGANGERTSFMGGSCLSAFTQEFTQHDSGNDFSMDFIEYMTIPETMNEYWPDATPTFLPVREGQEEIEPYTENNTDIPDEWIQVRLDQASDSKRYGITGGGRAAPFLGSLEGDTDSYSIAISGILGSGNDPKQAIVDQANQVRQELNEQVDYEVPENTEEPSLDDAPDMVQDWITGDGDAPQIWNPYE
ncbi:extracellular solute-binding protein [Halomontanus rarus]|uniref:extracellular solute-binding protein n=1 Tax=Halomontanus rarus TaxID=3034020 RepID=UPI0023E8C41E|nr:extracellular solute-binding protein [Halovivax sp. TS33]